MGVSRWNPTDWDAYAASTSGKPTAAIFGSRGLDPALSPLRIRRESRDSAANPLSTPIVVGLDVTGSMGVIADAMAREGLGTLMEEILARRPVSDPHVAFLGVGDALCDQAPLQATQFEADIRIADQLSKIWLEKGGGGNACESYTLPWWFAAMHVSADRIEKGRGKGWLFTVGDEEPPERLTAREIQSVFGEGPQQDMATEDLLAMVSRDWEVFHVMVEEGSHFRHSGPTVAAKWERLLGQRALRLSDHKRLAEVVVSAIEVASGRDPRGVSASWSDAKVGAVVARAVGALAPRPGASSGGLVRL